MERNDLVYLIPPEASAGAPSECDSADGLHHPNGRVYGSLYWITPSGRGGRGARSFLSGGGTMASAKSLEKPPVAGGESSVSPAAIAARAYEIYLRRGGGEGREVDDWLQAEAELDGTARPAERTK
jgi:hypothetical protein